LLKPLHITWKRLVSEGATCPRCGSTEGNLTSAVTKLDAALRPLGVRPVLETQTIDAATYRATPSESSRIWIDGKPMEDWLGAREGNSPCCDVCGDTPCRTMEVDGRIYEAIPEELIVKAALLASSQMIGSGSAQPASSCCSSGCSCG
jgi:hypothetical protein